MKNPKAMAAVEAVRTNTHGATQVFQWRALISVVVALSFLLMLVSGIGLWVAPPGRWALAAFCQEEGIDLQTAQSRLKADGIEASASLTLREIAAKKGYQSPREVLEIIRGDANLEIRCPP